MKNRKGFTLVELLAVIVILALLLVISVPAVSKWIDRSRKENLDSQKSMLVMATQSYIENHTESLPKAVGESTKIKASDLTAINYLNSDIKDGSDRNCTNNSYVTITKKENNNYDYEAFIYCEGDTIPKEVEEIGTTPKITIKWTDAHGSENPSENVSISKVIITIEDRLNPLDRSVGLNTYRYVISGNYEEKDKTVEIYNSENIQAEGKSTLTIEKDLTKLVDVSKITNFEIQVEAYTTDGGHLVVEDRFYYKDTIKPLCGQIVGEARDNEWTNGNRKISVECKDNNGSGCIQDVYAKTFTEENEFGYITITDKAGKSENCRVKVHIDRQKPTANITFNNNISNQTLTIKMNDDRGLSKYYFGTSNPGNTTVSYTNISGTTNTITPTIINGTTYYLRIYDLAGNFEDYSRVFYKTILTPNKSSVSPNNIITLSGNSFTIPTPMATTGYTFGGWYKENTLVNSAGTTYTPTANTTLYGKWNANPYSISYTMNGGVKGTNGPTNTNYDKTVVIDKPTKTFTVTIDGNNQGATLSSETASSIQIFDGWTATDIESTTRYGTSETNITSTWNGTTKIGASNNTVYFKNLKSTNGTVNMIANWKIVNITLPTVTKTGYVCGYATTETGNVTYVSGASYTPSILTNSSTLYVKCTANTYNISYVYNGGEKGTNEPKSATYDSNVTVSRPTKTFIVNIDANSQGASIKVGNTAVTEVSGTQTFDGWTATGLNTTTAKYGTSISNVTTTWSNGSTKIGASNDPIYLKNLNPTNGGTVELTANWKVANITLPTVTKQNYDCGFSNTSNGSIIYNSGDTYQSDPTKGSINLYVRCSPSIYTITLNNQSATSAGTTEIYEKYNTGYYTNSDATTQMTTSANKITVPTRTGYTFGGYYTGTNGSGTQYIGTGGFLTSSASNTNFTAAGSLFAKWTINPCVSFADDSWSTIVSCVKAGKYSNYTVGSTKEVELGNSLGTHTLRIANTSTPSECSTAGFSQTACGFVLEFADIITTRGMNSTATNVGGWSSSEMRTYLNSTSDTTSIYNSLPTVIKDAIADTTVVSGHGSTSGEANFTSTDKLYLLSSHEVWEDVDGNTNSGIDYYDTAYNNTRQLDYYANQGVTTSTNAGAIKQRNSSNYNWWLRSAYSSDASYFFRVGSTGSYSNDNALYAYGVAPAFRIA